MITQRSRIHPRMLALGFRRPWKGSGAVTVTIGLAIDIDRNENVAIIRIAFFEAFSQIFGINPRVGRRWQGHFSGWIGEMFLFVWETRSIRFQSGCCCGDGGWWRWERVGSSDRVVGCLKSQQAIVKNHRGNWILNEVDALITVSRVSFCKRRDGMMLACRLWSDYFK